MLFESSIVRIDSGADVCGTGFVISDSLVLTCAHVVCNDKGYLLPALRIVFHHAPGESAREVVVEEQWWRAPNGEDIAVLRIEPPAPPGVTPALLAASAWHGESEGETFGFPKVGKINGVHGRGQVLGALQEIGGRRLLQIDSKEITSGFSGAPFVDTKRRRVIGMVTEIVQPDEHGRLQRLAILTPTETLIEVCPFLQPSDACPYRGLLPFSDADEDLFFGRERLISELTEHLRSHSSLLVLVGSSGSGKSSVIAAGVVPRLRRGRVQRFRAATIVSCRPGMRAEESIRHALLSAGVRVDPDFEQGVRSWTGGRSEPRLVLVIDQFEEVFAHEANGETSALLAKLVALTQQPGVTVILIIRADFYESLLHSPFGDRLENAQVNVRPMTAEEQQEAIVSPARALGLTLSDNLTTLIQRDLERVQHPLPLLEFALTELWHGRTDGELTASEYERIGGVAGSIGQWATTAFESLSLEMRDLARQIFTRLVHYGIDGLPDSRRRLPLAALLDDPVRDAHVQELIGRLAKARLIVIDRDERTGEDVVEIIHDALLREWRQLASWVRDQRAFLVWRQALQLAVATWERHGRSADWLLRGGTLTEASRWLEEHRSELGSSEIRLIEASEQEQEGERRRWKAAYDRALTRHLVSQAELIRTQQPSLLERSVLIALEALRRAPSAEAMMALRLGLELLPVPEGMIDCGEQATQFVFSSDGNYVALLVGGVAIYQLAGKAPRLVLRRVCNLREVVFENDATRVTVLDSEAATSWSLPDGVRVANLAVPQRAGPATLRGDGEFVAWHVGKILEVWRVSTSQLECRFDQPENVSSSCLRFVGTDYVVAISHPLRPVLPGGLSRSTDRVEIYFGVDGQKHELVNGGEQMIRTWCLSRQTLAWEAQYDGWCRGLVTEDRADRFFVASGDRGVVTRAFDASSGNELWRAASECKAARGGKLWTKTPAVSSITPGMPIGRQFNLVLHDSATGRELARTPTLETPDVLGLSYEGTHLVTQCGKLIQVWDETAREVARVAGNSYRGFSSDWSDAFFTGTSEGTIFRWRVPAAGSGRPISSSGVPYRIAFSASADLLIGALGSQLYAWDIATGQNRYSIELKGSIRRVAARGDIVAAVTEQRREFSAGVSRDVGTNTLSVRDARTGKRIIEIPAPQPLNGVALDEGGTVVVTGGSDGSIWYLQAQEHLDLPAPIATHPTPIFDVEVSCHGSYFAAIGYGWTEVHNSRRDDLSIWAKDGTLRLRREHGIRDVRFSQDEVLAVVVGDVVELLEADGMRSVAAIEHSAPILGAEFAWRGHLWVWGGKMLALWSLDDLRQPVWKCLHDDDIWEAHFSRDRSRVAVRTSENIRVWRGDRREEVAFYPVAPTPLGASLTPDGNWLALVTRDGRLRFEAVEPDLLRAIASARLSRRLSRDEWSTYLPDEPYIDV